jgi:glycosyltransferase involved in cell wall biosynthesis
MGYGACILAHDTVFNREVAGDAGLFFPTDAEALGALMRRVEGDPGLVADLRQRGPRRITAEYTWDKIARQYEQLFREVVGV